MSTNEVLTQDGNAENLSARLAAIVEFSEDAIISKDLQGIVQTWNNAAEQIFGYTAEEIIGSPITKIIPPEFLPEEQNILSQIRTGNRIKHYETVRQHKDGLKISVSLSVSPVRNKDGQVVGASSIVRDISQTKKIENELRESQAMLYLTMQSSRIGAWSREISTGKLWWSKELEEIFGYPHGTFSRNENGFYDLILEDDRENVWNHVNGAVSEKRDYEVQFRFRRADGAVRWMEARGKAVYSNTGEPLRSYGIGIDITERKQAEDRAISAYLELLSRIVHLAQIFGTAKDLISIYRAVREFVSQSMPCTAFFVSFYDAENSLRIADYAWGNNKELDTEILPPLLISENGGANAEAILRKKPVVVGKSYTDALRERRHVILENDGIDPNSSLVVPMILTDCVVGTVEVQAYEENAFNTEHTAALEMVANLAAVAIENVRLLEATEKARHEAESANLAKDEFLSTVSHELRTPLNSILGWTQILKTKELNKEKTSHAIGVIEKNVRLQNSLIEDLLDVSRIISGEMRIEKRRLNLATIVSTAIETARPSAEQKKINLTFENSEVFCPMNGDETRLQQIVLNLINNAVKFTSEGGSVTLNLSCFRDKITLEVTDTGIGINSELLPRIFEKFSRADSTTKRSHSGLGLGLTIVKNLTELHDGKIIAASRGSNQGATFTLEFPVEKDFRPLEFSDEDSIPPENSLKNARILMVDDDSEAMLPLQILLENEQVETVCVTSGQEALDLLNKEKFDLLISDIGMPDMDGYELLITLRNAKNSQNSHIPAVALTAYVSAQDQTRAAEVGFSEHFGKPIDFDKFIASVKIIIRKHLRNEQRKNVR